MKCTQCGGTELTTPRTIELTKEIGTVAVETHDDKGKKVLEDLKAVICRKCGAVQLVVGVAGRDWTR